ncbi:MAG: ATP-binding protein [Cytophagaceae bacterium]
MEKKARLIATLEKDSGKQQLTEIIELLSSILDSSPSPIFAIKSIRDDNHEITDFKFVLVNTAAERVFKRDENHLLNTTVLREFPHSKEKGLFNKYKDVIESKKPFSISKKFNSGALNGWYQAFLTPWNDGVVVVLHDISEIKEIQEALKKNQTFLEESQAIAHIASFENDLIKDEITVSPEYYRMLGFNPDQKLSYKDILERIVPEDRERVLKAYDDAVNNIAPYNVVYKVNLPSGEQRYIWGRAKTFFDESGKPVKAIGTAADVTRLKRTEDDLIKSKNQLKLLNEELEEKVKVRTKEIEGKNIELKRINEGLDKFTYIVSHDLKAPVNALEGLVSILKELSDNKFSDIEAKEVIGMMEAKLRSMEDLISDLLLSTKENKKIKEPVNLFTLTHEVVSTLNPPENFHVFISHALPTVIYHKISMTQILQNLIGNAIKYMDKEHPLIKVSGMEYGKAYKICIEDNGQGIPEKKLTAIFNPFEIAHTNEKIDSHGIGLSIVKQLVEEHGGKIWAESELGKFSRFHFSIPK